MNRRLQGCRINDVEIVVRSVKKLHQCLDFGHRLQGRDECNRNNRKVRLLKSPIIAGGKVGKFQAAELQFRAGRPDCLFDAGDSLNLTGCVGHGAAHAGDIEIDGSEDFRSMCCYVSARTQEADFLHVKEYNPDPVPEGLVFNTSPALIRNEWLPWIRFDFNHIPHCRVIYFPSVKLLNKISMDRADAINLRAISRIQRMDGARFWAGTESIFRSQQRMRFDVTRRLYESLKADGYEGTELCIAFVAEYLRLKVEITILAHEGRHAIDMLYYSDDFKRWTDEREFRAKLSQVVFTSDPEFAVAESGILSRSIGANTQHGKAGERIIRIIVEWMEKHAHEIAGMDTSRPLLPQFDLLSPDQMRAIFIEADPMAGDTAVI